MTSHQFKKARSIHNKIEDRDLKLCAGQRDMEKAALLKCPLVTVAENMDEGGAGNTGG